MGQVSSRRPHRDEPPCTQPSASAISRRLAASPTAIGAPSSTAAPATSKAAVEAGAVRRAVQSPFSHTTVPSVQEHTSKLRRNRLTPGLDSTRSMIRADSNSDGAVETLKVEERCKSSSAAQARLEKVPLSPSGSGPAPAFVCRTSKKPADPDIDCTLRLLCSLFGADAAVVALRAGISIDIASASGSLTCATIAKRWVFCMLELAPPDDTPLVVSDLRQDARFKHQPHGTGGPDFTWYAAAPLLAADNSRLGSLCLFAEACCPFEASQSAQLCSISAMVGRQLERSCVADTRQPPRQAAMAELPPKGSLPARTTTPKRSAAGSFTSGLAQRHACRWDSLSSMRSASWGAIPRANSSGSCGEGSEHMPLMPTSPAAPCSGGYAAAVKPVRALSNIASFFRCSSASSQPSCDATHISSLGLDVDGSHSRAHNSSVRRDTDSAGHGKTSRSPSLGASRDSGALVQEAGLFDGLVVGQVLGRGSFGRVYYGTCHGHSVAVKIIDDVKKLRLGAKGIPMEASITVDLSHPHLVATLDYAAARCEGAGDPSLFCLLMEFCDQGSLLEAVSSGRFHAAHTPSMPAILATAAEVAAGMAHVHANGIVHGDLTGSNVLLTSSPVAPHGFRAKVSDFGLSRWMNGTSLVETKSLGTVTHMPPELLLKGHISQAGDVYAFGVLLWEMYSGRRAYEGMMFPQVVCTVTINQCILQLPHDAPAGFAALLASCLAREPTERPVFGDIIPRLQGMRDELT